MFIQEAIGTAWLSPYNVIVCDNAAIHQNGYSGNLADFLWKSPGLDNQPLNILLLQLSTRSPHLSSIELVCNTLVMRVKYRTLPIGASNVVVKEAETVSNAMDFDLIRRTY